MVTGLWESIATFLYSRIWIFSTVLTKDMFPGGNFLSLHTVIRMSSNGRALQTVNFSVHCQG